MSTSLGMPPIPPPTEDPPWKRAWDAALFGPGGYLRRDPAAPRERPSATVSASGLAAALAHMARSAGLDTVVHIGAGRGDLLAALHRHDPGLSLLGVDVSARPEALEPGVDWTPRLPESVDGLMVATRWLEGVPCHVVEVDRDGVPRVVHVAPVTGEETLGSALTDNAVPDSLAAWCARWWPLEDAAPGTRAEVGSTRDAAWADVVHRLDRGIAVALESGHVRDTRPPAGSLHARRADGSATAVVPDGSCDITAGVALDAVADAVAGQVDDGPSPAAGAGGLPRVTCARGIPLP